MAGLIPEDLTASIVLVRHGESTWITRGSLPGPWQPAPFRAGRAAGGTRRRAAGRSRRRDATAHSGRRATRRVAFAAFAGRPDGDCHRRGPVREAAFDAAPRADRDRPGRMGGPATDRGQRPLAGRADRLASLAGDQSRSGRRVARRGIGPRQPPAWQSSSTSCCKPGTEQPARWDAAHITPREPGPGLLQPRRRRWAAGTVGPARRP